MGQKKMANVAPRRRSLLEILDLEIESDREVRRFYNWKS
jgi:hypothetical protein